MFFLFTVQYYYFYHYLHTLLVVINLFLGFTIIIMTTIICYHVDVSYIRIIEIMQCCMCDIIVSRLYKFVVSHLVFMHD